MINIGHDGAYNDSDHDTCYDEKPAEVPDARKRPVGKKHYTAAYPGANQVAHEDMPGLYLEVGVEHTVHANRLVSDDGGHRGCAEDPGEKVPPTGKPTTDSPISSGRYRCPMIDYSHISRRGGMLRDEDSRGRVFVETYHRLRMVGLKPVQQLKRQ